MTNAEVVPTPGEGARPQRPVANGSTGTGTGYSRAFNQLCHLIPLSNNGKWRAVFDDLVLTAFVIDDSVHLGTPTDIAEALFVWFEVRIGEDELRDSVERHLRAHRLTYDQDAKRLSISPDARAEVEQRIDSSRQLEVDVRTEWSAALQAAGVSEELAKTLWTCLRHYMAKAFMHHGALAVRLLDPKSPTSTEDAVNLNAYLDEAITECAAGVDHDQVRALISSFFSEPTPSRVRYVAHLLDTTFTFFALTIHESTAYMKESLAPLSLFLDTNFIFGLFSMHENPMAGASKELISVISEGNFPFTLYYHERTLKEIQHHVTEAGAKLTSRSWSSSLSRAVVQAGYTTGIELAYHRANAEAPLDTKAFISKWERIDKLLEAKGVKIYRAPVNEGYEDEQKWKLTEEYRQYTIAQRRERAYEVADHDITVWLSVQNRRKRGSSALDVGAVFLSTDVLFARYDSTKLRQSDEVPTVVLPAQLLQVLRPFATSSDDFDRRFIEAFAIPELRSAHSDYGDTRFQALSFLTTYKDVPEETAVSILTNDLLMHRLRSTEEGSEEFAELIENAVFTSNQELREEKDLWEARAAQERAAAEAQAADFRDQLAVADTAALSEAEKAREDERTLADERVAAVEARAHEDHVTLEADLEEVRGEVGKLKSEREDDRRRQQRKRGLRRSVLSATLFLLGAILMVVLPHVFQWLWLLHQSNSTGLSLCATAMWGSVCWWIAKPTHRKGALAALFTLFCVLITVL